MLINSCIYKELAEHASMSGAGSLISLIKEGEAFEDDYQSTIGLPKSTYSILPCVYTNSSTQTALNAHAQQLQGQRREENAYPQVGSTPKTPMYSVMYAGTGNKITIRRKAKLEAARVGIKREGAGGTTGVVAGTVFKKPILVMGSATVAGNKQSQKERQRRGCRCGNATAMPGKLTCCGQRCPCYVDGKACLECRCRGCRNPHAPDGSKVIPHYLQEFQQPQQQQVQLVHHTIPEHNNAAFLNSLNTLKLELDHPVHSITAALPNLTNLALDNLHLDL